MIPVEEVSSGIRMDFTVNPSDRSKQPEKFPDLVVAYFCDGL